MMAQKSMRGESQEKIVSAILGRVKQNMAFLTPQDIKVLEHMSTKGDFNDYEAYLGKSSKPGDKFEEVVIKEQ